MLNCCFLVVSIDGTITNTYDHHLTHDKVRREIVPSQRNNYASFKYYALNVDKGLKTHKQEPSGRHSKVGEVKDD